MWDKVWDKMSRVSAKEIEAICEPCLKHIDDNLFLKAQLVGGKLYKKYLLRYQLNGKRIDKSLGSTNKISLKEARAKARELLDDLEKNQVTPAETLLAEKKLIKESQIRVEAQSNIPTVRQYAKEVIKLRSNEWKDVKGKKQDWENRLEKYAFNLIGDKKIDEVKRSDVFDLLMKDNFWVTHHTTAKYVRQYLSVIFRHYIGSRDEVIDMNDPADSLVLDLLPKYTGEMQSNAALHHDELPRYWQLIKDEKHTSSIALKMIVLTAQRQGDVLSAECKDVDLENGQWNAKINKLCKRNKEVRLWVPLPDQLVTELKLLQQFSSNEPERRFLFPSANWYSNSHISETAVRNQIKKHFVLDDYGNKITMHGFRTTFIDWVRNNHIDKVELGDIQLSHGPKDRVDIHYKRDKLFEPRRELLQAYADYATAA